MMQIFGELMVFIMVGVELGRMIVAVGVAVEMSK
jgi:hypothetical protein